MDYANSKTTIQSKESRKTAATAHAARGIPALHAASEGCTPGAKGQAAGRACSTAADGFLRAVFPPALKEKKQQRSKAQIACITEGFSCALRQLAHHYGIATDYPEDIYPNGVAAILRKLQEELKATTPCFQGLRLVHNSHKVFLIAEERYNTGTYLYYIPVVPLYKMLHNKPRRKAALLLLSVCSWLYRCVGVPYYRQNDTYLYWQYDMIWEWVAQDEDGDYRQESMRELETAAAIGDAMQQKLAHPANVSCLAARLKNFAPEGAFENECQKVALLAHQTLLQYPQEWLQRNIVPQNEPEDGYEDDTLRMDKYIGFSATTGGWLFDTLSEMVSNEFNECGTVEEPTVIKCFDGNPVTASLDFECKVFDIINRLCDILYDYKME